MPSLRELQQHFSAGLLDNDAAAHGMIAGDGIDPARRLQIYRRNVQESLTEALRTTYPVVRQLVGDEYFDQTARGFLREHPSRHGNLHHLGQGFARYLRGQPGLADMGFVADMADFEWLRQSVYHAAEAKPMATQALAHIDEDAVDRVTLRLHPALAITASQWPVLILWEAHQPGGELSSVDLNSGGEYVLIRRNAEGLIQHIQLNHGAYLFLHTLSSGRPLTEAIALAANAGWDVNQGLAGMVADGFFVGIQTLGANTQ